MILIRPALEFEVMLHFWRCCVYESFCLVLISLLVVSAFEIVVRGKFFCYVYLPYVNCLGSWNLEASVFVSLIIH